jgi:hypothetical protein
MLSPFFVERTISFRRAAEVEADAISDEGLTWEFLRAELLLLVFLAEPVEVFLGAEFSLWCFRK